MEKLWLVLLCFALGGFFVYKMFTARPHALKKEPVCFFFKEDFPAVQQGAELARFPAKKGVLVSAAATICGALFFIFLALRESAAYAVGALLLLPGVAFVNDATRRVVVYEYAVAAQSWLKTQTYFFAELERLESFNVLNAFHRGVDFGYRFCDETGSVLALRESAYKGLAGMEAVFQVHPAVAHEHEEQNKRQR